MVNKLASGLFDIVKDILVSVIGDKITDLNEKRQFENFKTSVLEWCDSYITRNETTVIASDDFAAYIRYYRLIENIISFVESPCAMTEQDFITQHFEQVKEYLSATRKLTPDDSRCIKEFIQGILEKTKGYFQIHLPMNMKSIAYELSQIEAKIDTLHEHTQPINLHPAVNRIPYAAPVNTITREIAPFSELRNELFLFSEKAADDPFYVCSEHKHIVLLGEAGCGKSIAIEQLAAKATRHVFFTLCYPLKNYTNETIASIIDEYYPSVTPRQLFLIFDGFDEIEESNRNGFARKINSYVRTHPHTIIVISSRNNFYGFADDEGHGSTFENFKEYGLRPFTENEIDTYLHNNGIDVKAFREEVSRKQLSSMLPTPFYLRELIKLYKESNILPPRAQVMDTIIRSRFKADIHKYVSTKDIQAHEIQIMGYLEQLAFSMQSMHCNNLTDASYQTLFGDKCRSLVNYTGIFSKDSSGHWQFEHNNFREYLAAKYLNRFDINTIKRTISGKDGKVANSWHNVLSYLVLIRAENDLRDWLATNNASLVVKFERNRVHEDQRNNLFITIMQSFAERNMWLSHGSNSAEELAAFGQSSTTCEYLLSQVQKPLNFRAQSNAICVLSKFSGLFGMKELVRATLFECVQSENTRAYEKYEALHALAKLELGTSEITEYLVSTFNPEQHPDYLSGVLIYLLHTNNHEEYLDLFINGHRLARHKNNAYSDIRWIAIEAFEKVKNSAGIGKVIRYFAERKDGYSEGQRTYRTIISNAIELYSEDNTDLFDSMLFVIANTRHSNKHLFQECVRFLTQTNTLAKAFMHIIDYPAFEKDYLNAYLLTNIGNDDCYRALVDAYSASPNKYRNIFVTITECMPADSSYLPIYQRILEQDGIPFHSRSAPIDYDKERKKGIQRYFDSLFNKDDFDKLIHELVEDLGNKDISFSEFNKQVYTINYDCHEDLVKQNTLYELSLTLSSYEFDDLKVVSFTVAISWENFAIGRIYSLLQNESVMLTAAQRTFIEQYCRSTIAEIDFDKEISKTENGFTYTWRLCYVMFFSSHLDIAYEKDIYLQMLQVPSFLYERNDDSHDQFSNYLLSHLSKNEIINQVQKNVARADLCADTFETHLRYCQSNHLECAVELAVRICKDPDAKEWTKRTALEYLDVIKGCEYIYDQFLDTADDILLKCIVNVTVKYQNQRLRERLEERNHLSSTGHDYLCTLISMNSKYGLMKYYEFSKELMVPFCGRDEHTFHTATSAIESINSPELLEIMDQLRQLLFTPNFKDAEIQGLYNSLFNAYQNIAKADYDAVKNQLEQALKNTSISDSEKSFCNTLLNEIERTRNSINDIAWTIQQVERFLSNHPITAAVN